MTPRDSKTKPRGLPSDDKRLFFYVILFFAIIKFHVLFLGLFVVVFVVLLICLIVFVLFFFYFAFLVLIYKAPRSPKYADIRHNMIPSL